jgi:hypothetical protein
LYAIALGPFPTLMVDITVFEELLITEMVFEPKLDTYTLLLSGLYTTMNGILSTFMVCTAESAKTFLGIKFEQDNTSVMNTMIDREQEKACFFIIYCYSHIFKLRNKLNYTMSFHLTFNI